MQLNFFMMVCLVNVLIMNKLKIAFHNSKIERWQIGFFSKTSAINIRILLKYVKSRAVNISHLKIVYLRIETVLLTFAG